MINRVRARYEAGELALGTYVTLPTGRAVDVLAGTGLDFVRFDPYKFPLDHATLRDLVRSAEAAALTPWARVRHDAWEIGRVLDAGVQLVTVPNVASAAEARALVRAVFHPPLGEREVSVPAGSSRSDHLAEVAREVLLGCQIETRDGIDHYQEIIATPGVNVIHTGRTDIAAALGVPGDQFHPGVMDVERRIVEAALEAGKQPSLFYPLTDEGFEHVLAWAERGVRIFALDTDYRVLHRTFAEASTRVRRTLPTTDGLPAGPYPAKERPRP